MYRTDLFGEGDKYIREVVVALDPGLELERLGHIKYILRPPTDTYSSFLDNALHLLPAFF